MSRSARVPSATAAADYIGPGGLGPGAIAAAREPDGAGARRAAAPPRRPRRAAALPAQARDAAPELRAARTPARLAQAALRQPAPDGRLRVRRAGRQVRDRPRRDGPSRA